MKFIGALAFIAASLLSTQALAQQTAAQIAPGQTCKLLTQESANASAGVANINHDGTALPGQALPDASRGFGGIPRSAQPTLTAAQRRILECTYRLPEANADFPYTLFVPSTYDPKKPTPLIVNLHGLNITPLQQILFDGVADYAEQYGYIVVAPMGYSLSGPYRAGAGQPVATAQVKPGGDTRYTTGDLSELDVMTVLKTMREKYNVDPNRVYLMGHSLGGGGTYTLGGKYNDIWAAIAPLAGAGGISAETAQNYKNVPVFLYHGSADSIVSPAGSARSAAALAAIGAQYLYVQVPGADHEFWIRRGAKNMERVFMFFNTVSKANNPAFQPQASAGRGGGGAGRGAAGRGATPAAPAR